MKRTILIISVFLLVAVIFGVSRALVQSEKALIDTGTGSDEIQREAIPQGHIGNGKIHKVFVNADKTGVYDSIAGRSGVVNEVDYGSFKMLIVDEEQGMSRAELSTLDAEIRDEQNLIAVNDFIIDTTNGKADLNRLPSDLRQTAMADSLDGKDRAGKGLYIVQFIGPIKDEWLDQLKAIGGKVVTYLPHNAYVVQASEKAAGAISEFRGRDFVQFVGDYEPAFRLSPDLQNFRNLNNTTDIDIVVQVIDGKTADETIARLKEIATEFVFDNSVLNYRNIAIRVNGSSLGEIASMDNVFALEERTPREKLDEAQGQIVAGNLTGTAPSGPGYLAWLGGKGFNSSQFTSFAVNVVDDAYTLTGTSQHPDLPSSRVPFQNNPTSQAGSQGGHGFLNSHIVGGINSGTGTAVEDASGYNYGLGIAPWSRVGVTAIFGAGSSTSTAWENTAYGQTSRISSNSWGYTGTAAKRYNSFAQEYDRIVRDAQTGTAGNQELIIVFAAGNDGSASNTVSSPATAKNIITAGASENVRQTGTDGCAVANSGANSVEDIIGFSSRGPVNSTGGDGRIKPDLVAPGTHVEGGVPQANYDGSSVCNQYWPTGQTLYGWSSGTSHSCPAIAGGMALVFQDFLNKSLGTPTPAMAKATLMNSAAYMNGTGAGGNLPSNSQGMGRMDLGRAFDTTPRLRTDQTQVLGATGNTYTVNGSVADTSTPYRVTLAWSDAPGPTTGAPFVNNLDLEVTVGGITYKGNIFSGANSASGGTADAKNNVESVFLPAGTSGNFTVTVRATNIAGDGVTGNADTTDQDFALLIYNGNAGGGTSPTIGVNPSSFSFSGTAGGSNPAGQTLNITNTGTGTLNWTASSNQSWLSISAASGTAPSSPTVSTNITGLAAGTYNGTITVSAAGATNSPVSVPVTLTVNPAGGSELLVNGGFEGSVAPWVSSGTGAFYVNPGNYPHGGTGYIYFGVNNNVSGQSYQTVAIPTSATGTLTFWLNVTSSETTTTTQYDKLFVEVRNTSGTLLATLATYSNLNKGTAGVYSQKSLNMAAYKGQTVRVQFRSTTDVSLATTFRVDDASLQ